MGCDGRERDDNLNKCPRVRVNLYLVVLSARARELSIHSIRKGLHWNVNASSIQSNKTPDDLMYDMRSTQIMTWGHRRFFISPTLLRRLILIICNFANCSTELLAHTSLSLFRSEHTRWRADWARIYDTPANGSPDAVAVLRKLRGCIAKGVTFQRLLHHLASLMISIMVTFSTYNTTIVSFWKTHGRQPTKPMLCPSLCLLQPVKWEEKKTQTHYITHSHWFSHDMNGHDICVSVQSFNAIQRPEELCGRRRRLRLSLQHVVCFKVRYGGTKNQYTIPHLCGESAGSAWHLQTRP